MGRTPGPHPGILPRLPPSYWEVEGVGCFAKGLTRPWFRGSWTLMPSGLERLQRRAASPVGQA